jgi:MFS family permease
VEGVGGACSWAGGIAWVAAETPQERRGALIGRTLAAAIGGALLGPVIGTLATAIGRAPAFGAVVVLAGSLILACRALPSRHVASEQGLAHVRSALAGRGIGSGMWLVALPAIASGVMSVLAPLRLHRLGASAVAIGATFLLAAVAEALVSPLIGSLSDRRGRLMPLRLGLVAIIGLLACFTLPDSALLLAALVVAVDGALGAFWAPAMAMLSDAAEGHALDQGLAAGLMNLAWAAGQALGSGVGGPLASAAGDIAPTALAAALCLGTLVALGRGARGG